MRGRNPTITRGVPGEKDADSRCSIRSSACSADRFFHCFHDPLMRRTPAEIVIQYPDNVLARCFLHRSLSRSVCLPIEEAGAAAAVVFPAAVLRACQTKVGSEDPEELAIC